jgi:predicted transcriptional regulator
MHCRRRLNGQVSGLSRKHSSSTSREAEKRRLIQEGLDDVTAGRLIPMEQARAWANSLGTDNELPVPKA